MDDLQFRRSPSINEVLKKGDAAFYLSIDDPMITCKYWSLEARASGRQKVVYMRLTCHEPMMLDLCNRQMGDKIIKKPAAVKHYILRMGGVYVCIKMTSSYIIAYSQAVSNVHKICVRTRGVNDVTFFKFMHDTITLTLQVTLS